MLRPTCKLPREQPARADSFGQQRCPDCGSTRDNMVQFVLLPIGPTQSLPNSKYDLPTDVFAVFHVDLASFNTYQLLTTKILSRDLTD